jgi:uncharacterized spore protein YtfJ
MGSEGGDAMGIAEVLESTRDAITVKRVYGEPYEKDGLIILPAATVAGGGGGGESDMGEGKEGSGAGMGMGAKPAGAFVVEDGHVTWRPAIDVNRVILGGQIVAVVALLVFRSVYRARTKARMHGEQLQAGSMPPSCQP